MQKRVADCVESSRFELLTAPNGCRGAIFPRGLADLERT
jgi:hypothetical protein